MSGKRGFEDQIAALEALRQGTEEVREAGVRKALGHRNNFIAGKAADLARECKMDTMIPDLITAFERFLEDPVKRDPQCWAKNAISKALAALEYQEADVFLRGMRHIQMEPVWGGRSDTAGTLRATCAFALVQCRSLSEVDLLRHLVELFGDKEKSVRAEAVRAIEQLDSPTSALLLRERAIIGGDEPEVLGACYGGVLRIEGPSAIAWVKRFLEAGDDSSAEAALALAGTHTVEAFEALRDALAHAEDPWFRSVLLSAISLTRQDAAVEFLLDLVRSESLDAERAMEAILRSAPSQDVTQKLQELVAPNPRLVKIFEAERKLPA